MSALSDPFNKGDFIEVTTKEEWKDTFRDFGVIRGTALDSRGRTGEASFKLWMNSPGNNNEVTFDLNYVHVTLLFPAFVARGEA